MYFETMWLYVVVLWCECCQNFSEAALPLVTKPAHQKSILGCLNVVLPLSSYPIAVRSNLPYPPPPSASNLVVFIALPHANMVRLVFGSVGVFFTVYVCLC